MALPENAISLDDAASEIRQACEDAKNEGVPSPFFFIVGAGISYPPIPLAGKVTEECKAEAVRLRRSKEPIKGGPLYSYSHWFNQAYPNNEQRQRYLKKLIEGQCISQANFRLAQLLLEEDATKVPISNLVVTTNFDDFLSRALRLFGKSHVVCDHPETTFRIGPDKRKLLQIVHVHGTFEFYDCKNLTSEIEANAAISQRSASTMSSLLDAILRARSPLVVGYSGWEGDVLMSALRRRLVDGDPLPYNLYWFCYRPSEIDSLPAWLKDHGNVRLVIPRDGADGAAAAGAKAPSEAVAKTEARKGAEEPGTLPARLVFEALIREFGVPTPRLTNDPLAFFADELQRSFPKEDVQSTDAFALGAVIGRVKAAAELVVAQAAAQAAVANLDAMIGEHAEQIRDANRRADYREAIRLGAELANASLSLRWRNEVIELLMTSALGLLDNSLDEIRAYETIAALGQPVAELSAESRAMVARALAYLGATFVVLGRVDEGLRTYDELVSRFDDPSDEIVQVWVAMGLFNKGVALAARGALDEAVAAYDLVADRYGSAPEEELREQVVMALFSKGVALYQAGRVDQALAAYQTVMERFGSAPEERVVEWAAKALVNKGVVLGNAGRDDEALAAYDAAVERFGSAPEAALREQVAKALFNKGVVLGTAGHHDQALAAYDAVEERFGSAPEASLREQVAKALFNKGVVLGTAGHHDESLAAYDAVVERFGSASEEPLREQVAMALVNKGVALGNAGHNDEALAVYDAVVERFGSASDVTLREQVAMAMFNRGIILGSAGRAADEIAAYDAVVERFGPAPEAALREQVADALFTKGTRLRDAGRGPEAKAALSDLLSRFRDAPEPSIRATVEKATRMVGELS